MTIRGQTSEYQLLTEDHAEYPSLPPVPDGPAFTMACGALATMLQRTMYATADENTRWAMGGVLFRVDGKTIQMAATDARRLSVVENVVEWKPAKDGTVPAKWSGVVASSGLDVLLPILQRNELATVSATFTNGGAFFGTPDATVMLRLLDGKFPPFDEIISRVNNQRGMVMAGPLCKAVRQASLMVGDDNAGLRLTFKQGKLTITAESLSAGKDKVELLTPNVAGEFSLTLREDHLADYLATVPEHHEIALNYQADDRPMYWRVSNYRHLMMPIVAK